MYEYKGNIKELRLLTSVNRIMAFILGVAINFDYFMVGGVISFVTLLILLYFVSVFIFLGRVTLSVYYKKILVLPFLYLALLILMNLVNSNTVSHRLIQPGFAFCLGLFVFVFFHLSKDNKAYEFLLSGLMTGGILMSFFFWVGVGVEYQNGRLTMFGTNPNNLGCLLCLSVAIMLYKVIIDDLFNLRLLRFLFLLTLFPIVRLILSTGSRTAFFSMSSVALLVFLVAPTKYKITKVVLVAILIGTIIIGYGYLLEYEDLYSRIMLTFSDGDLSNRESIWARLVPLALDHPFGIGQTGYTEFTQQVFLSTDIDGAASPHNVLLEVALYTGFLGLFIMSLFWFRVFRCAWYEFKKGRDLLPILLMLVIFVQMLLGQILTFRTAWVVYAYVIAGSSSMCFKKKYVFEY